MIAAGLTGVPAQVDVLVVGLGITGVGVALDAVTRGPSVLAVDAHDLAFGTSRWSSKLVHGGLHYLARGQLSVAHESAVERGIVMQVTAPHLTHAIPMVLPLGAGVNRRQAALLYAGLVAGDALRLGARTTRETLPRPRRISATEARHLAQALAPTTRGALLSWDGQLEDDARLVTTIARTAASSVPDVLEPTRGEVDFLLEVVSSALARPLTDADVAGSFTGLRPLLRAGGRTADLSRRHAVLSSTTGVVTVVGGKLTTYRRMAQDAVDAAANRFGSVGPCRTATLPLSGAAPRRELAAMAQRLPPRLVRRYGADAAEVLADARAVTGLDDAELLAPVAVGIPTSLAELVYGITHEGAYDVGDLLDRRTRVGLVPADRAAAVPAAERALALAVRPVRPVG